MAETFNSEGVKQMMDELETHFQEFAETLKDINTTVNELVNNGPDSAIFGEVGSSLLNTWNYNSSTFGDFHANFQNWTEVVSVIAANNAQFVVAAESIYRSNGSNLEGVQSARQEYRDNPTASEYYQNAQGPTMTPEEEADDFINRFGLTTEGQGWILALQELSPEAQRIVLDRKEALEKENTPEGVAETFYNEVGFPDGSLDWKDKFDALPSEAKIAYINQYGGRTSSQRVADSSYGTTSVIPANGEYDGRNVVVPKLTAQDFENVSDQNQLRNGSAQIIVDSANAVRENLGGESTALQSVLDALPENESFNSLTTEQQQVVRTYLQTEINNRNTISETIKNECYAGAGIDGTVGDATTFFYTVEQSAPDAIKGATTQYSDYAEAAREAESWNESLSNLNSLHDISAYLNSYGINSNGR